jgi:hypothetical protein
MFPSMYCVFQKNPHQIQSKTRTILGFSPEDGDDGCDYDLLTAVYFIIISQMIFVSNPAQFILGIYKHLIHTFEAVVKAPAVNNTSTP